MTYGVTNIMYEEVSVANYQFNQVEVFEKKNETKTKCRAAVLSR